MNILKFSLAPTNPSAGTKVPAVTRLAIPVVAERFTFHIMDQKL
jgi:hypothetical protein